MKVVEKDRVVSSLLREELGRCREMLAALEDSIKGLPKGVLSRRRKRYKDKVYRYFSLKYREGKRVVNKHVSSAEAPGLVEKIEIRKQLEREARVYEKRIIYLSKILRTGNG
jgi:hypothetical protein